MRCWCHYGRTYVIMKERKEETFVIINWIEFLDYRVETIA